MYTSGVYIRAGSYVSLCPQFANNHSQNTKQPRKSHIFTEVLLWVLQRFRSSDNYAWPLQCGAVVIYSTHCVPHLLTNYAYTCSLSAVIKPCLNHHHCTLEKANASTQTQKMCIIKKNYTAYTRILTKDQCIYQ